MSCIECIEKAQNIKTLELKIAELRGIIQGLNMSKNPYQTAYKIFSLIPDRPLNKGDLMSVKTFSLYIFICFFSERVFFKNKTRKIIEYKNEHGIIQQDSLHNLIKEIIDVIKDSIYPLFQALRDEEFNALITNTNHKSQISCIGLILRKDWSCMHQIVTETAKYIT